MKRRVRFLALVLALLLPVLAGSAEPRRYASPADLPAWAEQGAFRFIRIDGGRIETMKAERTWWGKEFSADEFDVLAHAYDTHFDQILARLKEAGFNWIWVTWSNGWSVETEAENRQALARVIERCHENGIHVTTYLSAVNTFWLDTGKHDPTTLLYGLWYGPVPVFYAGNPKGRVQVNFQRRLNDVRFKGWRDYVVAKAAMAIDAGADAVFYDNMIGDTGAFYKLLAETQAMARAKAAASGRPKAIVYSNVHIPPYRFDLNDLGEVLWMEDGKDTPGLWGDRWQVEGARKIRFLYGEKLPWQPLMFENDVHHCGARERCIPKPEEQKLQMAEAQAFGAALSRNIEGRFLSALVHDEPEAVAAWEAIAQYNRWFAEHENFYRGVKSAASVALICRREADPLADAFIRGSVPFETKVWGHLEDGAPLGELNALVVNELPTRMTRDDRWQLVLYIGMGGKILSTDPRKLAALMGFRTNTTDFLLLPGAAAVKKLALGRGEIPAETLAAILAAAEKESAGIRPTGVGARLSLDRHGQSVIARLTRAADGSLLVHLLNYDYSRPAEKVTVTINMVARASSPWSPESTGETPVPPVRTAVDGTPLLGCCPPGPQASVSAYSPDGQLSMSDIKNADGTLTFTVDKLDRYGVVVVK